jgi:hypothetical protein
MLSIRKSIRSIGTSIGKNSNVLEKYSTKHIIIGLATLLILIVCIYGIYNYLQSRKETFEDIPNMKRPFLNMWGVRKDGSEFLVNIVFITHPFTREECITQYNDAKSKGVHFLGLSSYSEFPGPISNTHDLLHDRNNDAWTKYDYFDLTRGWLSCFREENNAKWIKKGFPLVNITESDFANYEQHKPSNDAKEYDFIYICLKDGDKKEGDKDCPLGWQAYIHSFEQTRKLLDIMCKKFKLKGLLVGRIGCELPKNCHQLMETTDFMEYSTFIKQYNKCRFMINFNGSDASARCTTESMCFNLPVLMNKDILGGWHYINDQTGEFVDLYDFNAFEKTLSKFLRKLDNGEYHPREWFIKNYGKYNSGKRLLKFVKEVFKPEELNFSYDDIEYLKPGI